MCVCVYTYIKNSSIADAKNKGGKKTTAILSLSLVSACLSIASFARISHIRTHVQASRTAALYPLISKHVRRLFTTTSARRGGSGQKENRDTRKRRGGKVSWSILYTYSTHTRRHIPPPLIASSANCARATLFLLLVRTPAAALPLQLPLCNHNKIASTPRVSGVYIIDSSLITLVRPARARARSISRIYIHFPERKRVVVPATPSQIYRESPTAATAAARNRVVPPLHFIKSEYI